MGWRGCLKGGSWMGLGKWKGGCRGGRKKGMSKGIMGLGGLMGGGVEKVMGGEFWGLMILWV